MIGTQFPETCRDNNKYIKKICAQIWFYLQDQPLDGLHKTIAV